MASATNDGKWTTREWLQLIAPTAAFLLMGVVGYYVYSTREDIQGVEDRLAKAINTAKMELTTSINALEPKMNAMEQRLTAVIQNEKANVTKLIDNNATMSQGNIEAIRNLTGLIHQVRGQAGLARTAIRATGDQGLQPAIIRGKIKEIDEETWKKIIRQLEDGVLDEKAKIILPLDLLKPYFLAPENQGKETSGK